MGKDIINMGHPVVGDEWDEDYEEEDEEFLL